LKRILLVVGSVFLLFFLFFVGKEVFGVYTYYKYNGELSPNQKKVFFFLPKSIIGKQTPEESLPPISILIEAPQKSLSLLDGTESVFPKEGERSIMVMIDNIISARAHQEHIQEASIVFEALVEGGITRLLAVFSSSTLSKIEEIGPVRSARDYFLDLAKPFGGIYIHAGGSDQAMEDLSVTDDFFMNIDYGISGGIFFRKKNIPAPHNLYLKTNALLEMLPETIPITPLFQFREKNIPDSKKESIIKKIILNPSTQHSLSEWEWDNNQNGFVRSQKNTYFSFVAQNLLVMEVPSFRIPNDPKNRISLQNTGEGILWIFQEGSVQKGTWQRTTEKDFFNFFDEKKEKILLFPGRTWISLIPSGKSITTFPNFSQEGI
jgi:hypothetical protein